VIHFFHSQEYKKMKVRGSICHLVASISRLSGRFLSGGHPLSPRSIEDFTEFEQREAYFDKAQCATCQAASYYRDNLMRDLKVERF